jgi:hypothetical protein
MRKRIAFDFILLYQRTFYLLFPINYFLKMYRVSFILGVYSLKCTKQSVIGVHPCSFTGNKIYKTKCHRVYFSVFIHRKWNVQISYHCLHLRRNTLEKNTIYSYTRTLIGQKKLSQFMFNGQNFFFWLTPCLRGDMGNV